MGDYFKFTVSIPDILDGNVSLSEVYENYTARGSLSSYAIDLELSELNLRKTCKARDVHLLPTKITDTLNSWETRYKRHLVKEKKEATAQSVDQKNESAAAALKALDNILNHTLDIDDTVDWKSLYRHDKFKVKPIELVTDESIRSVVAYDGSGKPRGVIKEKLRQKPTKKAIQAEFGLFTRIFQSKKIAEKLEESIEKWEVYISSVKRALVSAAKVFDLRKNDFQKIQEADNAAVDQMKARYESREPAAIEEYCELVLQSSEYPDEFPQSWDTEYQADSKIIVVDYQLPTIDDLPTVESYRHIKTKNEVVAKELSGARRKRIFESVIYQTCIRTIHELLEADLIAAIDAVAFNGIVTMVNAGTGIEETKTVLSVLASEAEFAQFDLSRVDPKATFKHLKGLSGTAMIDLTPVRPLISIEKRDRRFVDSRDVVDALDESVNLAAMDWEDFEHLVRELFQKEFAVNGGEVKVTQASSDGGVDAIAFDPDPIRGGKIVIQAKRYTNVVGVAAVRDLYGTVMNEGATKGILVTTSGYGNDSYQFAKDKPLTLLNGQNLLHLLEKHGHRARINVREAKEILKTK